MLERFAVLLQEANDISEKFWEDAKKVKGEFTEKLNQEFKRTFPRKKKIDITLLDREVVSKIREPYQGLVNKMTEEKDKRLEEIKNELDSLAQELNIPIMEDMECHHSVSSTLYHTQGYGAARYAKENAQNYVDIATWHDLKAEVRLGKSPYRGVSYEVWVNTSKVGWEILTRKPGIPLRDWLKWCWKRGVNPRVYKPFLPVGLEEEMDIDYFGNDRPA